MDIKERIKKKCKIAGVCDLVIVNLEDPELDRLDGKLSILQEKLLLLVKELSAPSASEIKAFASGFDEDPSHILPGVAH